MSLLRHMSVCVCVVVNEVGMGDDDIVGASSVPHRRSMLMERERVCAHHPPEVCA